MRPIQPSRYTPLSVRHGSRWKKLKWAILGWREAVALWLAPWFRGAVYRVSEHPGPSSHQPTDASANPKDHHVRDRREV